MADVSTTQHKLTAEALGTFVLVFFGCGAALISGGDYVATAMAFGLTVLVMVYAVGRVSGGHFNPAVSVGAGMSGRLAWPQVGAYVVAQLVGAIVAGVVLLALMHGFEGYNVSTDGLAQNSFGDQGSGYAWWAAFILEMLMTAVFLMVILAVTDGRNEHPALAPLAIGLSLTMIHLASIGATGTSVNPARSIGVGLFAGSDAVIQLWLFILAPLLGGAIAGLAYPLLFGRDTDPVPGSGFKFSRPAPAAAAAGPWGTPDQYQQQWNQDPNPAYTSAAAAEPVAPAPIVQDGWQWDPIGQQWHPVGQTPEQWRAQQAAEQQAAQQQPPAESVPEQQQWPESDAGDGGTQIRPPGQQPDQ
jgi:aquaporin Z